MNFNPAVQQTQLSGTIGDQQFPMVHKEQYA